MKDLVLFDIDGTLVSSGRAAMECLGQAFHRVTGREFPQSIFPAGKTDPLIVREAFRLVGYPKRDWVETEQRILRKYPRYFEDCRERLAAESRILPGVNDLLSLLRQKEVPMGLLTGNLELTARSKLAVHGLNGFFPVGGFGSDCADRNRLARVALERACRHFEVRFPADRVWVIGDTPNDIAVARALGARALAVGTGPHSKPVLEEFLPDVALDDLTDVAGVLRLLQQR